MLILGMLILGIVMLEIAFFFVGVGCGRWSMRQDLSRQAAAKKPPVDAIDPDEIRLGPLRFTAMGNIAYVRVEDVVENLDKAAEFVADDGMTATFALSYFARSLELASQGPEDG